MVRPLTETVSGLAVLALGMVLGTVMLGSAEAQTGSEQPLAATCPGLMEDVQGLDAMGHLDAFAIEETDGTRVAHALTTTEQAEVRVTTANGETIFEGDVDGEGFAFRVDDQNGFERLDPDQIPELGAIEDGCFRALAIPE